MTFRKKILFSIWGVVLGLLVITFFIINYWMRSRMEETFSGELRTAFSAVSVHEKLQSAQLIRACVVIAESPRLRAVAELGDSKTAYQLLQELNRTTLSQLFILTDRQGRPLVQLLRGVRDEWAITQPDPIASALRSVAATDVWPIRGMLYRVVSVPMVIETELVGTLTIGFEITRNDIATLKRATNTDLLLMSNRSTVLSTLDSAEAAELQPAVNALEEPFFSEGDDTSGSALRIATPGDVYLGRLFLLHHSPKPDSENVRFLMIKPLSREVRQSMSSILKTFGFVSLVFLGITTIIGLVISKSMTRPITELVRGTTEIARGNYDYGIEVRRKDELGFLAVRFMEMSASLKDKVTQLGKLNQDLLERNRTLDETLRQLQSAQEDLLRSERLAATGKMTAQLAHEINNPIHNIQSCLKTALSRLPPDIKGRDLLDVAFDEVGRLSRLTGQMLNFYRNSLVEEELSPISLNNLLGEIAAVTGSELAENNISVSMNIDPDLPPVRGSRDKLKQVFLNLFSNARDAMPDGGTLELAARAKSGTVRVSVRDSGAGIAQENLDRIFDAFFTTKKKVSGVGLGLSVSYGIVSQHRGSIDVESAEGKGSTFTVVLPYEDVS